VGPGVIRGTGLDNRLRPVLGRFQWGQPLPRQPTPQRQQGDRALPVPQRVIRDVAILHGGWFAILATGVSNLTIDHVLLDTNRDGMDIDACRNVRVTPVQRQLALGRRDLPEGQLRSREVRACEDVVISDCFPRKASTRAPCGTARTSGSDAAYRSSTWDGSSSARSRTGISRTSPSPLRFRRAPADSRSRASTGPHRGHRNLHINDAARSTPPDLHPPGVAPARPRGHGDGHHQAHHDQQRRRIRLRLEPGQSS